MAKAKGPILKRDASGRWRNERGHFASPPVSKASKVTKKAVKAKSTATPKKITFQKSRAPTKPTPAKKKPAPKRKSAPAPVKPPSAPRKRKKRTPPKPRVAAPGPGERGVYKVKNTREMVKEALEAVCAATSGGGECLSVRTYAYSNLDVDGELRMRAPSKGRLIPWFLALEANVREQEWPEHAWYSIAMLGSFTPSRNEWGDYGKKFGMECIEMYPTRMEFMADLMNKARRTVDALYRRQSVHEVLLRVFTGKKQPNRRMTRGIKKGDL